MWQIDRNDIAACLAFYEAHGATEDEWQVMLQLQDDPTSLRQAMRDRKAPR